MRCAIVFMLLCRLAVADELRLDARELFDRSVTHNVRLSNDAIELEEGELIEDDGPAAGYSYKPNEERVSDTVWIKKELIIPDAACRNATLLIAPGGELKANINGQAVELKSSRTAGKYWQAYSIPPDVLKLGRNEIILSGSGRLWIARSEDFATGSVDRPKHPGRSARSADGGNSWEYDRLGVAGDIAGEYYVRLFLDRPRANASLTLGVIDIANLAGRPIAPPLDKPVPVRIRLDGDATVRARSSSNRRDWSDWIDVKDTFEPTGRYIQLALHISKPLKSLAIEAMPPNRDDWSAGLKVIEAYNPPVIRSSIPFAYEPFDHPKLKEFRKLHKLDDIVKDAPTELALIERLARWSATRWQRGHLSQSYPAWDALDILKPHADGTPVGGFCQQYNLVFLQACESLGIPGRAVSISAGDRDGKIPGSGHEVVELWSNQFRKWISFDGNMAWYATDDKEAPLSLFELRARQLRVLNGEPVQPTRIVHLLEGGKRWDGLNAWPPFLELRLIPRSNFLEKQAPLPLNQGMRGWFWSGHYAWTDAAYPASLLYGHRVSDRRNWEWPLNHAHISLEATGNGGELRVHLDTQTPGFERFLADIDGKEPQRVSSGFVWKLHQGDNRLKVWPQNSAGRDGIASEITVISAPTP